MNLDKTNRGASQALKAVLVVKISEIEAEIECFETCLAMNSHKLIQAGWL
ncbi:MAG: hypothetical protein M1152_02780 [Actinobacteria bacterium]|nr:hypothetical protein [Actinomycetota bacterium]